MKLWRMDDAKVRNLGPITRYVFEDDFHKRNRVGVVLLVILSELSGPPTHCHRFRDDLFFMVKGAVRFIVADIQYFSLLFSSKTII
ncbi:putative cupin domain-containing protein [Diaporthe ampelina]|uniref:Putative cupin domain-containing protein n=1 Tax=Diaporthe ampelina TaxID=1214573 RepID=A0A0G2FZW5_9PEZI|nr:putative cupin domain-containing protein [Diaporthe ampelina]